MKKKKKGLPIYFWLGCLLLYGYVLTMMILEMNVEGMTYSWTLGGAPASFFYNGFIGVMGLNFFLAWLWVYLPERDDKRSQSSDGGDN
ncbi:hypothetical protein [Dethiobacter alkaliphilus]|uniref:Uncharacterized protein n=1 Tax=Dethiobacter alkaliphilus AHT 1 TaxID=555088 RepID=C0GGJ2_DETAL|nr:hypothetical protein [Dethiobacter alkaliphilus]EEG77433.1 hypothetical protein DealDRAFT_1556 [Dethiobacter alkaliphilus AHT 1]